MFSLLPYQGELCERSYFLQSFQLHPWVLFHDNVYFSIMLHETKMTDARKTNKSVKMKCTILVFVTCKL